MLRLLLNPQPTDLLWFYALVQDPGTLKKMLSKFWYILNHCVTADGPEVNRAHPYGLGEDWAFPEDYFDSDYFNSEGSDSGYASDETVRATANSRDTFNRENRLYEGETEGSGSSNSNTTDSDSGNASDPDSGYASDSDSDYTAKGKGKAL